MNKVHIFLMGICLLFSCSRDLVKNAKNTININNDLKGVWSNNYINDKIELRVDSNSSYEIRIPYLLKKSFDTPPTKGKITLKGECARSAGGFILSINRITLDSQPANPIFISEKEIHLILNNINVMVYRSDISVVKDSLRLLFQNNECSPKGLETVQGIIFRYASSKGDQRQPVNN